MLVASFSVHDDQPRVLRHVPHPARWLVKLYATDGKERLTNTLRNHQPCMLSDLLESAQGEIDDLLDALPAYTDAGFQVVKLR